MEQMDKSMIAKNSDVSYTDRQFILFSTIQIDFQSEFHYN